MKRVPLHHHVGWVSWAIVAVVIAIIVVAEPERRGVSGVYEEAARHWVESQPLYGDGYWGFLYAPQSAMSYVPFLYPTPVIGSFLWRLLGMALLATGLMRWVRLCAQDPERRRFTIATWLLIPIALSSLRNGQTNPHMIGVSLHGAAAWAASRHGRAAAWMAAGLLAKPLALVFGLLAGATDRRLIVPLVIGLVVFLVLPFAHPSPDYVWDQTTAFADKLVRASDPGDHVYTNVEGIFHKLGTPIPAPWRRPIQLGAALATLAAALWSWRRTRGASRMFAVLTWAAAYLMLFNPRTEANTYVFLAPMIALLGAAAWTDRARRAEAVFLTAIALALGCDNYGNWLHSVTDRWLKPSVTLLFVAYFVFRLAQAPNRPLLPVPIEDGATAATIPV